MKTQIKLFLCLIILSSFISAQVWKPANPKLLTEWGEKFESGNVLPEYPRPQLVRNDWKNLNGFWEYAIQSRLLSQPQSYKGKILVPFAVESALSGVGKTIGKENYLWYKTTFTLPVDWKSKNVLLHFGAVDWEAIVYLNGTNIGEHRGGYSEFSFDLTKYLRDENELIVRVWDPVDDGTQPRGKQVKNPEGIWYTSVTGIWQTVWLEAVNPNHITAIKNIPDIDKQEVQFELSFSNQLKNLDMQFDVMKDGKLITEYKGSAKNNLTLKIPNPLLWSPSEPNLYDLKINLLSQGKVVDEVSSYFGMRKISLEKDQNGIPRIMLNNKFLFQFGPLDQGWWPDGLYTAPTDEALASDLIRLKELGCNMLRKHVKVEPARFYYHADKIGMLIWQDMPSGDLDSPYIEGGEVKRFAQSEYQYEIELREMIDNRMHFPSIIIWVPFNESWGQFNTIKICNWISHYDPSRLVDGPSGWSDFVAAGHIQDRHDYPGPSMPTYKNDNRALVLGEFGGLGLPLENHTWQKKDNWGYRNLKTNEELENQFIGLIRKLPSLIQNGLSAAVYTQTTDVEIEVNGLMTYDRKIMKMNPAKIKDEILKLYEVLK